jgi:prevent-host-death family protein
MERVVSATEARVHFGELLRHVVETAQPIVVERGGKPQVVMLSVQEYERLIVGERAPEPWEELLDRARARIAAELGSTALPPPEDIIRTVREERDAQFPGLR